MRGIRGVALLALAALSFAFPAFAQGTGGSIEGFVKDEQGLALPGATVTVNNPATGLSRSVVTDSDGAYRLPGLPIGAYDVKIDMSGFAAQTRKAVRVNVAATTSLDIKMSVQGLSESVDVVAEAPLIDPSDSGVGEIITQAQIENLPLNGRQFGNLAALVPGVGLGFHTDPTKSTQFAPQAGGGGGRNINYAIDGGDNNDDTVGGLVQNFPLDSIAEFNFQTQRFKAEYGRANGGVLNVVTKSGTNDLRGSVFGYFRDKSLNGKTETERLNEAEKGEYSKKQYGGSLGGPIVKDRTHFFVSFERIQQDTEQIVNTQGLFPAKDGTFGLPFRENIAVGKITHQVTPSNFLAVRYGYNDQSQVYGASPLAPPESWGDSTNKFHSANLNLSSSLGGGKLNEFVFQYSYFKNAITERSTTPTEFFPNGVTVGQSINTPQKTEQHKYQFRDDFTWARGNHEWKMGVNFIYEPTLDITFSTGQQPQYTHLADSLTSPISNIQYNGSIGGSGGLSGASIPNKQYAAYIQDTWRPNEKWTFDLGVRYDLVTGFAFDQDENRIFSELQAAGRAGLLSGMVGLEDFGQEPAEDKNNIAPRAGFTFDTNGDGKLVFRGGAGRYYDFAYTNANILFAVIGAQSSFGLIYNVDNQAGIRNADGSLYQVGQPLPPNGLGTVSRPLPSHAASPLIKQPYTDQANLGFSKALGSDYALEFDAVYAEGKDLGVRPRLNFRINGGARRLAGILPTAGGSNFRVDVSRGRSHYKGATVALKKRWDGKLQFLTSYTLSKSTSTSRRATDEFIGDDLVNPYDPFGDVQEGPVNSDARHKVTASAVWSPGFGFTVAPIFRYRSKTPYNVITGTDDNKDGVNFDPPAGTETVNSARGSDYKQFDLRLSKKLPIGGEHRHVEVIAEGFNLFNSKNPGDYIGNMKASNFGQPTTYAGDFQRGEQRLFQVGARIEF